MTSFFSVNEHPIERIARVVIGVVLISLAFVGPKTPWGFIGILPVLTGTFGMCPLYSLLGVSTCSAASRKAS